MKKDIGFVESKKKGFYDLKRKKSVNLRMK